MITTTTTPKLTTTVLLFATLLASTTAQLNVPAQQHLHRRLLQSYGGATDTFSVHLRLPNTDRLISAHLNGIDRRIATRVAIDPVRTNTGYNLTTTIEADGELGFTSFKLVAKTESGHRYEIPASVDVIGVRFAKPVIRQTERAAAISAHVYGGRNAPVARLVDCRLSVTGRSAFLRHQDVTVNHNTLILRPTTRVGREPARILVDCPTIGLDGDVAESELSIQPDIRLTRHLFRE